MFISLRMARMVISSLQTKRAMALSHMPIRFASSSMARPSLSALPSRRSACSISTMFWIFLRNQTSIRVTSPMCPMSMPRRRHSATTNARSVLIS